MLDNSPPRHYAPKFETTHPQITYIFMFSSRTTGPISIISTKFGRKHYWVKWIQFYSNEEPRPLKRKDDLEFLKNC